MLHCVHVILVTMFCDLLSYYKKLLDNYNIMVVNPEQVKFAVYRGKYIVR